MLRVSGTLQKSGEVMKLVNDTLKLPEMQRTMFEMSKGAAAAN
jgi:charged multivesicular body protein 3